MPNFDKQQRDFLKGPGNKENFNETNFSGYDQANIAASPALQPSPLLDNGDKDGLTDEEVKKFKSDMGKYDPTITSYEGDAFVGTRGGRPQEVGSNVQGRTEGTRGEDNEFVKGIVTGPSRSSKSEQSRRIKGSRYSS